MTRSVFVTLFSALILLSVTGRAWSAWTSDIKTLSKEVQFEVYIQKKGCSIAAGFPPVNKNDRGEMRLGSVYRTANSKGVALPVVFSFSKCDSVDTIQKIEFTKDHPQPGTKPDEFGGPDKGFVSTEIPEVKVHLLTDDVNNKPFKVLDFQNIGGKRIQENEWVTVCYAQARVDSRGASEVKPFKASAEFLVTYQ